VPDAPPPLTWEGFREGVRMVLPLVPGVVIFALAIGAASVREGLSLLEATLMSTFVYAGAAQLVALEAWTHAWTGLSILAVATVTFAVNMRMILMGAAFRPWLAPVPPAPLYAQFFFLTDANFILGSRYRAEGGRDVGMLLGAGLVLWLVWIAGTIPGHMLGTLVVDPRAIGLDLFLPIFFAAMAVPLWRGRRSGVIYAVAGLAAILASLVLPGYAFIVVGALAGALAGALLDE
jgi:predicted branched-subunit amino acid permease